MTGNRLHRRAGVGRKARHDVPEQRIEIQRVRLRVVRNVALFQKLRPADQLVERPHAQTRHDPARFIGDGGEIVDHHFRRAFELRPELRIRRRDAHRAGVEMALADVNAAHGDHRGRAEIILLGPENRGNDHVAAVADAAIGSEDHAVAQIVDQQRLLRLGQA